MVFRKFVLGLRFTVYDLRSMSKSIVNVKKPTANSQKNPTNKPIFLYLCAVVPSKGWATEFFEKKASFRLSVSVNLDNSRMLVRISEIKLAYECLLPNANRWGLFFSILLTGSPDPTEWRLLNESSTFFLCGENW